jgi:formate dehydrogenase assembly factor FdhD
MNDGTDAVRSYPIERVGKGGVKAEVDSVTIEKPLEIRVGGQTLAVTMRTPGHDFELAAGFLVAEGIVSRSNEILRIEHCREVRSAEELAVDLARDSGMTLVGFLRSSDFNVYSGVDRVESASGR